MNNYDDYMALAMEITVDETELALGLLLLEKECKKCTPTKTTLQLEKKTSPLCINLGAFFPVSLTEKFPFIIKIKK